MPTTGLVLFAHGARDARWREPFDRPAGQADRPKLPDTAVRLAFLELMEPSLPVALAELAGAGVAEVTVVPVFFGQGGHIRRDLPALIDQCRAQYPAMRIDCATAVGEAESVLDAIAAYCVGAVATTPSRQSPIGNDLKTRPSAFTDGRVSRLQSIDCCQQAPTASASCSGWRCA